MSFANPLLLQVGLSSMRNEGDKKVIHEIDKEE